MPVVRGHDRHFLSALELDRLLEEMQHLLPMAGAANARGGRILVRDAGRELESDPLQDAHTPAGARRNGREASFLGIDPACGLQVEGEDLERIR